jgi:hypothetical protein
MYGLGLGGRRDHVLSPAARRVRLVTYSQDLYRALVVMAEAQMEKLQRNVGVCKSNIAKIEDFMEGKLTAWVRYMMEDNPGVRIEVPRKPYTDDTATAPPFTPDNVRNWKVYVQDLRVNKSKLASAEAQLLDFSRAKDDGTWIQDTDDLVKYRARVGVCVANQSEVRACDGENRV